MHVSSPNLEDPDGFYAALLQAHEGLSDTDSALLNARLVLLMANRIGRTDTLHALLAAAREDTKDTHR